MSPANGTDTTTARLASVRASGRVAHTLLGVALDLVAPYAGDYVSADEYNRLSKLVEGPVEAATSVALATLTSALDAAIDSLDPEELVRLKAAQRWRV